MAADIVTGLDIGTSSIKAVVLSHGGNNPKLLSLGSIVTPQPGLNSDADTDLDVVAKAIRNLLNAVKAPNAPVVMALPESKVFTRVITDLPYLSDDELMSAIKYSSEEFVPLPVDQVHLNWQLIYRSKSENNTSVFVVASPKNMVNKYLRILALAKVTPLALETELIACTRALVGDNQFAPTTMIVQLGAMSTDYAIVSKGMILLTRSIGTGGTALTRSIAQYLNFELVQAEEYKKVYGMLENQLGGKIQQVLKPLIDVLVSEGQRVVQAFQAKNPKIPIKRVVLTGGGAKLPGLVVYFANNLGLEVQEADPWFYIEKNPSLQSSLMADAANYTVAAGLALRKG